MSSHLVRSEKAFRVSIWVEILKMDGLLYAEMGVSSKGHSKLGHRENKGADVGTACRKESGSQITKKRKDLVYPEPQSPT